VRGSDCPFRKTWNENSSAFVFSYLKVFSISSQEIWYYFIIDLKIRSTNHKCSIISLKILNMIENFLNRPRNNSPLRIPVIVFKSFHGVCFSCTSLSICENWSIIAFKWWLHSLFRCFLINIFLSTVLIVYVIKCEWMDII